MVVLGDHFPDATLTSLARAIRPQAVSGGLSRSPRLTVLPQASHGWQGTPGISIHRPSTGEFSFEIGLRPIKARGDQSLVIHATDIQGLVEAVITIGVSEEGLLHQEVTISNNGTDDLNVHDVNLAFPLADRASDLLDTTGRHLRERHPQRHAFTNGRHVRESRRGRPGHDATLLLIAGEENFGFEKGSVHGVHVAWSGNHRLSAEWGPNYSAFIQAGELLEPGEIVLRSGESYKSPLALGSWGDGLSQMWYRFHDYLRRREGHPSLPRPVTINTWEAVYFDMRLARLKAIADAAAAAGAERFVLDDGWFNGRRDDTGGLGDWFVDKDVWPQGLEPLWDHVDRLGLQCGIWVEPEMVNLDSEVGRKHPEWILRPNSQRLPIESRHQHVLDLSNPAAFEYILTCLDNILRKYPLIRYLKWDHNRDLLEAGSSNGRPAVHAQTNAVYKLMKQLKSKYSGLEIESCAGGAGRVDLGILQLTDRIWTSDCTEPLERLTIQKYTNMLIPYEIMGAHVGPASSHSTGRKQGLHLRAGVALFGHMGIEWDVSKIGQDELKELGSWIKLHKKWRDILHTGRPVYADLPAHTGADVRGVVSKDQSSAIYTYTQATTSQNYPPASVTLPGLDKNTLYCVSLVQDPPTDKRNFRGQSPLPWLDEEEPCIMTGKVLGIAGLRMPVLWPETLIVLEVKCV